MSDNNKKSAGIKDGLSSIPKAFVLFGRAFKNAKKDFWISIQVLFWVSLALSIIFYYVEHAAQPEEYPNWRQAFVWTITRYIGDPGHFAGKGPITLVGRHIDTIIGILKILIFAVPAGLVANGFRKAMEDDRKAQHLQECREKIQKSFRRLQNKQTLYRVAPRRISLVTLQAKKGMTENDLIDTVSKFDEFRLRNLATSQTLDEHPQDQLVIEMLPLNKETVDGYTIERTSYGIKINRNSNVTIVAPTAATENSIGHFAFYLAQFGGFNYISREFVQDVDEPVGYYTIDGNDKEWEEPLKCFVEDVKGLSTGTEKWNIMVSAADNVHDTQVHFVHKTNAKCNFKMLTKGEANEANLQALYKELSETLKTNYNLLSDMDEKYRPVGSKNIAVVTGGGNDNNAFCLRLSYSIITWTDHWTPIIVDMAKLIKQHLEAPERREFVEDKAWKTKGWGLGEGDIQSAAEKDKKDKSKNDKQ